jgi:hypothetical protein
MSHDYPWIAEYSLYRCAPLHTSEVCARKSLQDCSMVSSSFWNTHWGFTASVSIASTQKPPRVLYGFSHRSFPTQPVGTPRLDSTIYYIRPYPYRLMVVLFYGWSLYEPVLRFGYDNKPQASNITPDKSLEPPTSHRQVPNPITPNPILHTSRIQITIIVIGVT